MQKVKENKEQTKELADEATLWLEALVKALGGPGVDASEFERLLPDINQIVLYVNISRIPSLYLTQTRALDAIAKSTERRTQQGTASRWLNKTQNAEELTRLRDELKGAYDRFMVCDSLACNATSFLTGLHRWHPKFSTTGLSSGLRRLSAITARLLPLCSAPLSSVSRF
jgi:hypothetical protein